jgi:hypothetical protein
MVWAHLRVAHCVLSLSQFCCLRAFDCLPQVVRDGKIVHETQPQQHDFNLPYQLSHPRLFPDTDTADSADRWALR